MFQPIRTLGWATLLIFLMVAAAQAGPGYGKLSGVVVDPSGTPQMGATVWVLAEDAVGSTAAQLLTNQRGLFASGSLLPGLYSVRVTLAGFLPGLERHVRVSPNLTTLLRIELDSVFTSLDRLRRHPAPPADADDWTWVLRTSAATRPVLQWTAGEVLADGEPQATETARRRNPRGRVELTNGARRPGSVSNLADSPGSAFSYDQRIGRTSHLLLAGQMSYERASAAGGFATLWLPAGELGRGPVTSLVLRQAKLGPGGPTFRGARMAHAQQVALGERFLLRFGADYVLVGLGPATSSLRPHGELELRLSPNWRAAVKMAARPWSAEDPSAGVLQAALAELDAFPVVLWRNGHPMLERGWHQELAVERNLGARASFEGAAFRDASRHIAVFGRGASPNPEFLRDFFSTGFVYDGGASNSWGTRLAYREKLSDDLEIAAVYAWAGALAFEDRAALPDLRDALQTRYRHSLAARFSGRIPKAGTRVAASYKWVSGAVVSRLDAFGETAYQLDPYMDLSVRQPLPGFMSGKWEAQADFRNLLAQGYVAVNRQDGRVALVPALRSFRGGLSFQF